MKPTSIIFLVLSLVLILGGSVTCVVASNLAREENIELFAENLDADGDLHFAKDFTGTNLNIITVSVGKSNVTIRGGKESFSADLINFPRVFYELSSSNNNLTVSDSMNLLSIFKNGTDGIGFTGLRRFIKGNTELAEKQRGVEIGICPNEAIKHYDITIEEGDLLIENLGINADYEISVGKGSVTLRGVSDISGLTVNVGEGEVNIEGANGIREASISVTSGDVHFSGDTGSSSNIVIEATDGSIYAEIAAQEGVQWYLKGDGGIGLFGESLGTAYQTSGDGPYFEAQAGNKVAVTEIAGD